MSDDDGILDVDLDGDEPDVLDVVVDPENSPPDPARPTVRSSVQGDVDLPMISTGVCPRCGYALRPLEDKCPRCEQSAAAPTGSPDADGISELPAVQDPRTSPRGGGRGCLTGVIVGVVLLLGLAVVVPLAILMQPSQQARRQYELGLRAQLRAEFDVARQYYQRALELDPQMGLAAFSMGTTYLRVGDPGMMQSIQEMTERAVHGQTDDLDRADGWFRRALEIGRNLPPGKRLTDQRIKTPSHLRAFAHASLALTAYIRAAAAIQAEQFDDALSWLQVAHGEAQAAIIDDPQNAAAQQVLRTVDPMMGPGSPLP